MYTYCNVSLPFLLFSTYLSIFLIFFFLLYLNCVNLVFIFTLTPPRLVLQLVAEASTFVNVYLLNAEKWKPDLYSFHATMPGNLQYNRTLFRGKLPVLLRFTSRPEIVPHCK